MPSKSRLDYAIIGGTVIDGTGSPAFRADLLIKGGRIVFIGLLDTSSLSDVTIIYATDKVISPGFIDSHAHGDPLDDDFENFVAMGVTTILLGQDGESPVNSLAYSSARSFFHQLESAPKMLNLAFLAGHGSVRKQAKLATAIDLLPEEIEKLQLILQENLHAGCYGLSTGLEYLPGALADLDELTALAKVVGNHDNLLMSHLRSEDDSLMNGSLAELLSLGRYCKTHVSHIKVVYGKDAARAKEIIRHLERARESGIVISADVYPYMASYTGIGIVFPPWAKSKHDFDSAKIYRQEELRRFLYQKIMSRNGPEATLFASRPFVGKTLAEVSRESGKDFVDILMTLGPQGASGAYFIMNESLQECFILDATVAIASDGGPALRHPRSYGTFAKLISKYVVQDKKLALESAIHKATGIPAKLIGLSQRGAILKNYHADLLIFDPKLIEDQASFSNPFSFAKGFDIVMINGKIVRSEEEMMCENCGELLLKKRIN